MDIYYPKDEIFRVKNLHQYIGNLKGKVTKTAQRLIGKTILENMDPTPIPIQPGPEIKTGSFGWVYTKASCNGKKVTVKRLKYTEHPSTFLIEAIVQSIMHNYTKETMCPIQVPEVYRFGKANFSRRVYRNREYRMEKVQSYVIVMEHIEGKPLHQVENIKKHINTIVHGLQHIQDDMAFVHRDFHADNIIVSNKLYMIDFGRTCVGLNSKTIYDKYEWYTTKCNNRSHDVCTLIVNLVTSYDKKELRAVATRICKQYKDIVVNSPYKDFDENRDYSGQQWKDRIFHWHYIGYLEEVELEPYVPKNMLCIWKLKL